MACLDSKSSRHPRSSPLEIAKISHVNAEQRYAKELVMLRIASVAATTQHLSSEHFPQPQPQLWFLYMPQGKY